MADVGLSEGFYVGRRGFLNVRSQDVRTWARVWGLHFGGGDNLALVNSHTQGGISVVDTFEGPPFESPPEFTGEVLQITRDNTVARGFHTGAMRVGFRKQDVFPPLTEPSDPFLAARGIFFFYVQECNDVHAGAKTPPTVPQAPTGEFGSQDKVEGMMTFSFNIQYASGQTGYQMRNLPRNSSGGGELGWKIGVNSWSNVTISAGDFYGVELRWSSDPAPTEAMTSSSPRPEVVVKAYETTDPTFAEENLTVVYAARHRYQYDDNFWLSEREKWNINWGAAGSVYGIPRDPWVEGVSVDSERGQGFILTHFEVLDGT